MAPFAGFRAWPLQTLHAELGVTKSAPSGRFLLAVYHFHSLLAQSVVQVQKCHLEASLTREKTSIRRKTSLGQTPLSSDRPVAHRAKFRRNGRGLTIANGNRHQ